MTSGMRMRSATWTNAPKTTQPRSPTQMGPEAMTRSLRRKQAGKQAPRKPFVRLTWMPPTRKPVLPGTGSGRACAG